MKGIFYELDGYVTLLNSRNSRGGGLFVYIKEKFCVNIINIETKSFESICMIVGDTAICCVYRPPNKDKMEFLKEFEEKILSNSSINRENFIIIGDMNINLLETEDNNVNDYEDLMSSNGLQRGLFTPTRVEISGVKNKISTSCIDHIYYKHSINENVKTAVVLHKITDHYLIFISVKDNRKLENNFVGEKYGEFIDYIAIKKLFCPVGLNRVS